MPAALRNTETLRETCKALLIQGLKPKQVSEQTGVKSATLRTWQRRFNLKQLVTDAREVLGTTTVTVTESKDGLAKALLPISDEIRIGLAKSLQIQVKQLDGIKSLGNTPDGQGRASTAKTIAETASEVFGWKDSRGGNLNLTMISQAPEPDSEQEAKTIDVESAQIHDNHPVTE